MMNKTDKSLSIKSAVFLMSAVAVARGSSFIFSKQLLAGGMEPLNLLGVRSLIAFSVLMMFFGRRTIESIRSDHHNLTAGALTALNPLTTTILGIVVLREAFGLSDIIGAILILAGITLHNMNNR